DGKTFHPEAERLNGQHGRDFYAAQTFNNDPNNRRIEIGWWRTHTAKQGNHFNQSMSLPMEIKLLDTPEGLRIARQPVEALKDLRKKHQPFEITKIQAQVPYLIPGIKGDLLEIHAQFSAIEAEEIEFSIKGVKIVYDVAKES